MAGVEISAHIVGMENFASITRRRALSLGVTSLVAPFIATQVRAAETPVLVELFTSQGCSSCPPADKLAGMLKTMPDVNVMSFNVDYWDYLGWRDTLAKPEYTQRQMDYAQARGDNDVYTPQMIINGKAHVVGSNQSAVENAIAEARTAKGKVPLVLKANATELIVELGEGSAIAEATVWVMAVAPDVNVKIERGENSGSSITYHNVVRKLVPAGMWNGTATTLKLPRKGIMSADCKSCFAVLQQGKVGSVLGLASWSDSAA